MKPSQLSAALLGNMAPPSYRVALPPGREWVYEVAAWVFVALAVAAGGVWLARRRAIRPTTGRALLWATIGSLSIAYSAWWLWSHRNAGVVKPGLTASIAVWMPGLWAVASAIVLLAGRRRVRGDPAGRGPVALAARAFGLAVVTLAAGGLIDALGFPLALVVFLPGYLMADLDTTMVFGVRLAMLGVNLGLWWAAWSVTLWAREGFHADAGPTESQAAPGRGAE